MEFFYFFATSIIIIFIYVSYPREYCKNIPSFSSSLSSSPFSSAFISSFVISWLSFAGNSLFFPYFSLQTCLALFRNRRGGGWQLQKYRKRENESYWKNDRDRWKSRIILRQTGKQAALTDLQYRLTDNLTDWQTIDRQTDRQTVLIDRQSYRLTAWQTNRQTDRQTYSTDRLTV